MLSESNSNVFENTEPADEKIEQLVLKACQVCGRNFNLKSLERHEKVCEKKKKTNHRTVFNSFLQRAKEINAIPVSNTKKKEETKSKGKWKEEHENILRVVRGAKSCHADVMNNGLSPQKIIPSGYQQCPSCNRCFSQKAADRHIAWCQEQQTRLPKTPPNSEALERLKARVKYRAPLPIRKYKNSSERLVKSADSVRVSSVLRTHSSPPIPSRDVHAVNQHFADSTISVMKQKETAKRTNDSNSNYVSSSKLNVPEIKCKKSVKFKEKFPVYNKERHKNLEMLAALRQRLSELNTSEDFLDEYICRSNENEPLKRNHNKVCFPLPTPEIFKDSWTSDGEVQCNTSSSSDGSLPSLNYIENSERRMPRFCYNCGTKYPIVSAKFCCECGARRFIFGENDNPVYVN